MEVKCSHFNFAANHTSNFKHNFLMNILLIGSGGREHTLAWKLAQSKHCSKLYIAPGNAGTAACGTNLHIPVSDFETISKAAIEHKIELILVGPEEPLVKGIYDYFRDNKHLTHIKVIGPSKAASQLEGSKAFAKAFMKKHHIPTATYAEFDAASFIEGNDYIKKHSLPIVLKADGLAAGKGVLICESHLEAFSEFELMLKQSKFGEAGKKVVIEEFLSGIELSVFVLTDGDNYIVLPEAKDYKRIGESDTGLNTGGMGAVSPLPFVTADFLQKVKEKIIEPTIAGLKMDKLDYKGFIFLGLMNDKGEPKVIEYNCRLGDPETEVVIPRIKNDLVELMIATSESRLNEITIDTDERASATIVAVSGGYPGDYESGKPITGLQKNNLVDSIIFHSGTKLIGDKVTTNGGRVLAVTSYGSNIQQAVAQSNEVLKTISFEGMYYRTDIGYEFIENNIA